MRTRTKAVAVLAAVVLGGAALGDDEPRVAAPAADDALVAQDAAPAPPSPATPPAPSPPPADARLLHAVGGDGDSWRADDGGEYRLGMVNAPETDECFGPEATAERRRLTAGGFHADAYARDAYGRSVAVVTLPDGTNLNVRLARHGYVDDRYLAEFRHEHPPLAAELDGAFAAARADRAGLWSACGTRAPQGGVAAPPAPPPAPPPADGCHPDYVECLPVQGDGSGRGAANDLDCGDVRQRVQLRQPGVDPYRLDGEGDGYGCDSYG